MTGPELFPALAGWMAGTPGTHPLRELFDASRADDAPTSPRRSIPASMDAIIGRLETAPPLRLAAERKDFQNARTFDDLRIVRSELLAGGMLGRAGVDVSGNGRGHRRRGSGVAGELSDLTRAEGAGMGAPGASGPTAATRPGLPHRLLIEEDVAMSGEPAAAAEAPGTGSKPELRASHEDRDQVVEILRVAAGDGRLTAAELDERLEAALTARTHSDLAKLTADLPAAGLQDGIPQRAKELVRIDHMGGNVKRVGRWVVPQRMEIHSVGGNVKLDFTDAVITQPTLQIEAKRLGGNLILVTKPGIEVDADDVRALGGTVKVPPAATERPVILRVEISGETWGGNLVVRPPRRTFWQWLLRK